jgi:hypothetical protein
VVQNGGLFAAGPEAFDPSSIDLTATGSFDDLENARFSMTIAGKNYGPVTYEDSGPLAPSIGSQTPPSPVLLFGFYVAGEVFYEKQDSEFLADFPDEPAFVAALEDPQSLPISWTIEFVLPGGSSCSWTVTFDLETADASAGQIGLFVWGHPAFPAATRT